MVRKILKNKPLVEAIFELQWELQEPSPGMKLDPHYKILIGRMYDMLRDKYPFHEQLPTATMPDEIAGYVVQHRFRKDKDKWPLIQVDKLFEAYINAENDLKISRLLLRYIDAVDFDYGKDNIFDFLKEKMKMNIEIYEKLFEETGTSKLPLNFDLRFAFPSVSPKGAMHLRFGRGKRKDIDALVWETTVQSVGNDAPKVKEGIVTWVKAAHDLTDDWFFKIIEGELLKEFE
jgi:hypothetical protein